MGREVTLLDAERVLGYADRWRSLACEWAHLAGKEQSPHATKLRHAAQMALYAVHEAEQLLKARCAEPLEVCGVPASVPALPIAIERSDPSVERLRHGPLGYVMAIGPVSLAGQRPRSGPYSGRRASRLG